MRGVLAGVILTLGAQLLLVLLLRTLWARRALASLDSWLQRTFGVSLHLNSLSSSNGNGVGGSGSFGSSNPDQIESEGESDLWGQSGNRRLLSRAGSNSSSSSGAYSNGSNAGSREQ
jgi:hypothetical protein